MYKNYYYCDFISDSEKMFDFITLSREEFLQSYSYLTTLEYDLTFGEFYMNLEKHFVKLYEEFTKLPKVEKPYYKKVLKNFYKTLPKNKQENIKKELTKNSLRCSMFMW